MTADVIVVGAGLAGLSCARDLAAAGTSVLVLEARPRVGGRVEQVTLDDGRLVQLGGEVVGNAHTAYQALVAELGLTLVPSYVDEPGELTYVLHDGIHVGDAPGFFADEDHKSLAVVEEEFVRLCATVDPDDPWAHPSAAGLDRTSMGGWLRSVGATPTVLRAIEAGQLGLSSGSFERISLLSQLRKCAVTSTKGLYDYEEWENLRVAEGSATVALRLASGLDVRLSSPVVSLAVAAAGCSVTLASGETLRSSAVVSALPAGPFRDLAVTGVSAARLSSLHRQRHALAAKFVAAYPRPFWRDRGQNGLTESEGVLGSSWPQSPDGVLSCLVPPERLAAYLSTAPAYRREEALAELASWFGRDALAPVATYERLWGTDPWTQGYVTQWHPGDVHKVGPLHGTHEPPFYVCGSDQWVAGYMEGAVRTGRGAAAEALAQG